MKLCTKCKEIRPLTDYYLRDGKPRSHCKPCMMRDDRARQVRKYGITIEDYDALLLKQGKACAICKQPEASSDWRGKKRELAIDHCHTSGEVRGLLCYTCNVGLGYFKDNISMLETAIDYLKEDK